MVVASHRNAQLKINLGAIAQNVKNEVSRLPEGTQMFAVVKANGYGHGAVPVAKTAAENGATGFCVAVLDEALELRQAGLDQPILVLGITEPKDAVLASANNVSLSVGSLSWLQEATKDLQEQTKQLKIHLAIDSGMSRIGFIEDEEFVAANDYLNDHQAEFEVEGMFTHFASADTAQTDYFNYQVERFNHLKSLLRVEPKYIHVANTATSLFHEACHSDLVRFGIGIYGLNPSSAPGATDLVPPFEIKPALSLTTALSFVKQIHKGSGVSYGSTYIAEGDEWIGTVPVGYADGWQRSLQGFEVKVGDIYCPIVGRICMDQFMVKLPNELPVGTPVELISANPTAKNSLKAAADKIGTIHYEVACLFTSRLPRIYY